MTDLLLGPNAMSRLSKLSGNIDLDYLSPSIFSAQITKIRRILTPTLYTKIVNDFSADTLTGVYEIIYDEFVEDMLTYYALSDYIRVGAYSINQGGIYKNAAENTDQVDFDEISKLAEHYDSLGNEIELLFTQYIKTASVPEYEDSCKPKGTKGLDWFF